MTYRKYIFLLSGASLFGWASFALVLYRLEPCTAAGTISFCHSVSTLGLVLFFMSSFFALTATFTLLGFGLRFWLHQYEIYLDHLNTSLRQGILLTLCTLGALGLLILHALTWWSGFLLIAIIILVELYFTRA